MLRDKLHEFKTASKRRVLNEDVHHNRSVYQLERLLENHQQQS